MAVQKLLKSDKTCETYWRKYTAAFYGPQFIKPWNIAWLNLA